MLEKADYEMESKIKRKSRASKRKSAKSSAGIRPVLSCDSSHKSPDSSSNESQTNRNLSSTNSSG